MTEGMEMTEVTDGTDRGGATAHGTGRMGLGRWNGWGDEAKKGGPIGVAFLVMRKRFLLHDLDGRGAAVGVAGHNDVDALERRLALHTHHVVVVNALDGLVTQNLLHANDVVS